MKQYITPLVSIIGIVLLEIVAMSNGIDGKILTLSIASIAGIGGYKLKDILHG